MISVNEMFEQIKEDLKQGVVHFQYEKADGTIRDAHGTLLERCIPDDMLPNGTVKTVDENSVRYFDMEAHGWRTFKKDKLIQFQWSSKTFLVPEKKTTEYLNDR